MSKKFCLKKNYCQVILFSILLLLSDRQFPKQEQGEKRHKRTAYQFTNKEVTPWSDMFFWSDGFFGTGF